MLNCDTLGQRAVSDGEVQRTVHGRVHEFMSLTASGKKLHLSLVVRALRLRSLVPEGSRFMGRVGGGCCNVHGSGSASADVDVL